MKRGLRTQVTAARRGALALAVGAALWAGGAQAQHPGALWNVTFVKIDVAAGIADADALTSRIRQGLRTANETYFYGTRPVRMEVRVRADRSLAITLRDQLTGALLGRTGLEDLTAEATELTDTALAWMDKLECATAACAGSVDTAVAEAPSAAQVAAESRTPTAAAPAEAPAPAVARIAASTVARTDAADYGIVTGEAAKIANVLAAAPPVPQPKPGTTPKPNVLAALSRVRLARNPDAALADLVSIRLSRLDARGLAGISYSATDRLVLGEPRSLAPTPVRPARTPEVGRKSETVIGRMVEDFLTIFGFGDTRASRSASATGVRRTAADAGTTPRIARAAATPTLTPLAARTPAAAPQVTPRLTRGPGVANVAPFAPAEGTATEPRFGTAPGWRMNAPEMAGNSDTRLAALSPDLPLAPGIRSDAGASGIRVVPSPGLGLPAPRVEPNAAFVAAPIRVEARRPPSVRLDPEVFTRYAPENVIRLFGSYGNPQRQVQLVAATPDTGQSRRGRSGSVDGILEERGLALDDGRYAEAHRIYWSGSTGSRGFWINLPDGAPVRYVLIAGGRGSVIARVHRQGNSIQVSDAVAASLGMAPGAWSDVQVVGLRQLEQTAERRTRTRTR